jgi:hypothetical protein
MLPLCMSTYDKLLSPRRLLDLRAAVPEEVGYYKANMAVRGADVTGTQSKREGAARDWGARACRWGERRKEAGRRQRAPKLRPIRAIEEAGRRLAEGWQAGQACMFS